jgi:tRNA(Ile)-lysidine synthase
MHPVVRRVDRTIRQRQLLTSGDRVAAAVSGGADSVALASLLGHLAPVAGWGLAGLIHVHHGLRPGEADEDEAFVRALAEGLGVPCVVRRIDVPTLMKTTGRSMEASAREARYAAYEDGARRLEASHVATGHTADDQAETVMLRLLRGSGLRGVSAVRPRRGRYVRPLIDCRRDALRRYLADRGQDFREDSSNRDLAIPRNQLRHSLMPLIDRLWPGGSMALARFAELAAADELFLTALASREAGEPGRSATDGVQLDRRRIRPLPPVLMRRVLRDAIERAGGRASKADVDALRRLIVGAQEGAVDIGGLRARADADRLSLERPGVSPHRLGEYRLSVPGSVSLGETQTTIEASFSTAGHVSHWLTGDPARAVLQRASVTLPFLVRGRRDGDRLRPLGAPGSRKVQDLFVDRKVPRNLRDEVPLVVDATGRIVWVAGMAIADDCRVTSPEAGMVILEMKKGTQ